MFFENFPVFLLNFERVMSFGGFFVCFFCECKQQSKMLNCHSCFYIASCSATWRKWRGGTVNISRTHLPLQNVQSVPCLILISFVMILFLSKALTFHLWHFPLCDLCKTCSGVSGLKLRDGMDWFWCVNTVYIYIYLNIYINKKKTTISKWETNVKWLTLQNENHLKIMSWWMLSEIFFYILKSLEKKRTQLAKWEKLSEEHYKGNVFINL